jgi:hypothetical protein
MASVMLVIFVFAPSAGASVTRIHFSGGYGSGYADLTLGPAANGDTMDPTKPPLAITGASGLFGGATITGLQPLNPTTWPNEITPASASLFAIPGAANGGVSYDNLFYPGGSPLTCIVNGLPAFPFSGGFLDVMGVMFVLDNGNFVDLWSYGVTAPNFFFPGWEGGLTYGMALITPDDNGGYMIAGSSFATASVPEPTFLWLFGAVVLGLFTWRRVTEMRRLTTMRV